MFENHVQEIFLVARIDMITSFWSYEYSRIMIWHGLNFEHFKNLENLKNEFYERFELYL